MQSKNINWKSPTFWPIIDQVVREHIGKPNLREIVKTLQDRDDRFHLLDHQRLSDWRDKTQKEKIVWSEKTLHQVQKGFLPGGNQTRYSVFVSCFNLTYIITTDARNRRNILTYFLRSKSR